MWASISRPGWAHKARACPAKSRKDVRLLDRQAREVERLEFGVGVGGVGFTVAQSFTDILVKQGRCLGPAAQTAHVRCEWPLLCFVVLHRSA